ncbi:hypothetical protein [Gimesia aquarii]|uniref:Uncharacterized protein n=1 Tax=Gimesia aquarii TaxID=2527964 RepID=A0A517X0P5_9PLAN|nr:hypothetical protein [Gimesia aquarii]QDU11062.1 hypothetical protein V202x_44780 [Gimesia aquarii]
MPTVFILMPGILEVITIGIILIFLVTPFWMICSKAGFPGWISLGILIPIVNVILLYFLAFAEWPVLQHLPHED